MSLTTWLAYIMGVVYTVVIILCDHVFNYLACLYNGCGLHCKLLYYATMSLTTWLAYIGSCILLAEIQVCKKIAT